MMLSLMTMHNQNGGGGSMFLFLFVASMTISNMVQTVNGQLVTTAAIANDERLTKFKSLLDRVGLSASSGETIFAPTTDAWDAYEEEDSKVWEQFGTHPEFFVHLQELMSWHLVTEGRYGFDDIFDGSRTQLENAYGNITVDQQFGRIDNVPKDDFIEKNITASDGIIHVLSKVIQPPHLGMNIIEYMLDDRSETFTLSTMANLALFAGLDERINKWYENGITFLVPPNRRFNRAQIDVPALLTEGMFNYTRDFVLAHMIVDNYYTGGIVAYNEENDQDQFLVISELGTNMWITTTEDMVRFQSEPILVPDIPARNGIFHVMDNPLYPPFISDFTFFTPISTNWDTSDCFRFFRQALLSSEDISVMFNTTLTMFCPTREAFAFFNNEDFNRLLEPIWQRHATEFLLNHISSPAMTRAELLELAPSYITMLNGATYELRMSGDRPRIKNTSTEQARSDYGDLIALDGYLHIVDTALTPTAVSRSIYDQCNEDPELSLLVENIDFVDLTDLVDRDLPLTMFAPDNTAFRRITFGTLEGGEIIKRHLFRGLLFCDVLANSTQITSVNGIVLGVETRGEFNESLWVGGAYVYDCDRLARTGILHRVDRVIGEDYDTVSPTLSPAPTITATPTIEVIPTLPPAPKPSGPAPIALPPARVPTVNDLIHDDADATADGAATNDAESSAPGIIGRPWRENVFFSSAVFSSLWALTLLL